MVYVDRLRPTVRSRAWKWSRGAHLIADSVDELHNFARRIGLLREWYQPGSFPHYDLTPRKHQRALREGAQLLDRRAFVGVMRRVREAT